jgi:HTH-like domain
VKYAFIAEHRPVFGVRAMCRCLSVQPSGFYAWLKNPLNRRAQEDRRQIELIRKAWSDSSKVYGYRKLHDDLIDMGETCCPNRVARLAQLAGICAQIGYKRRPGMYGGKPSLAVDNTLDRKFTVEAPDRSWVTDITYIRTQEGFAYLAVVLDFRRENDPPDHFLLRLNLPAYRRLVIAGSTDNQRRPSGTLGCGVAAKAEEPRAGPFGSGFAVHKHGMGFVPERAQP